jgi:hypothetical protein
VAQVAAVVQQHRHIDKIQRTDGPGYPSEQHFNANLHHYFTLNLTMPHHLIINIQFGMQPALNLT